MGAYPYSTQPGDLKKFLKTISSLGVPDAVTTRWLPSVGFKSKNDRSIVTILKFTGLIDSSGKPTPLWMAYRDSKKGPATLAQAIRKAYEPLFKTYPDADRKDYEALTNFFKVGSTAGERAIQFTVQTFKSLCESADFQSEAVELPRTSAPDPIANRAVTSNLGNPVTHPLASIAPAIAINIELQIPATENAEIYDKLFAAMRKHLFQSTDG